MTQWFVKDLSKLTGVSVQTLHHYDRIDLLKPSLRLTSGYRVYCEPDLLKLQQIIALKFFGFELIQIKALLMGSATTLERFSSQAQFLEEKANTLLEASKTLKSILSDVKDNTSIPFKTIIQLIEVYRMAQQFEKTWIGEVLTPEELKQYATFKSELESKSTQEQKTAFEKDWADLVEEIRHNLGNDPKSAIGIRLGGKCMELINGLYGKKHANLRTSLWEKGFGEGKGHDEIGVSPEIVAWLDDATNAYWRHRVQGILNQVGRRPSSEVLTLWNDVIEDMYGDDAERKAERHKVIFDIIMKDDDVSDEAKKWLQSVAKS